MFNCLNSWTVSVATSLRSCTSLAPRTRARILIRVRERTAALPDRCRGTLIAVWGNDGPPAHISTESVEYVDAPIHLPLLPCSVGSTRHTDAVAAVSEVLEDYWRLPFWPQLPNRAPEEQMIPQTGLSLPGATWDGEVITWSGAISDTDLGNAGPPPRERAAGLYELLDRLSSLPEERKSKVVKGQIVGPMTLSRWSRDQSGRSPYQDLETLQRLGAWLGAAAAQQAQAFQRLGYQAIILFDEPELASIGEPTIPLPWREVTPVLRAAIEPVQRIGALAGIHCCASPNWTRILDSRPNLIHFDAREGHVEDVIEHHRAVREHVARGGYLGWGLWPTDGRGPLPFDSKEMQYFLANKARDLSFVDASVGLIFKRSMLTGVCGGAGLDETTERQVARDLEALSMGIRRRYWIAATTDVDPDAPLT